MGAFLESIHVKTENVDTVQKVLERIALEADCKFLLGPAINGWISIFPDHDARGEQASSNIAKHLPQEIFHLIVHDDDIFFYYFYRAGQLVDRYNSCPDYFEEVSEAEKEQCKGRPELFQNLLIDPESLPKLRKLLVAEKFTFESERMTQFVELLGWANAFASYDNLQAKDYGVDEIEGWDKFVHIEEQPKSAEDFNHRGEVRLAKNDLDGALTDFNQAIELNPDLATACVNRDLVASAKNNLQKAQAETWDKYGSIKKDEGDLPSALTGFNRAIELNPQFAEAYNHRGSVKRKQHDFDGALDDCNRAIEIKPDLAGAYNNRALVKQARGDANGAMEDFDKAIEIKPDLSATYNNRGELKRARRDWDGAMADYTRALELKPDMENAYNNRGEVKRAKGDLDGALADFNKAVDLKPDSATIHNNRGEARRVKGDLAGAIADYDRAIKLKPDLVVAYNNRGLAKQKKGDLEGALIDFNKAIELKPLPAAFNNRGLLKFEKKDPDGALADLNQAIHLNPKIGEFYKNRGDIKRAGNDLAGALVDLNEAIELKPDWAEAYNNRGYVKKLTGDASGALADYDKAIEFKPALFAAHSNRADIKKSKGDLDGALADYNRALELNPHLTGTGKKRDDILRTKAKREKAEAVAHLKPILVAESTLALRTDFSDESAWKKLCVALQNPAEEFTANIDFVSDKQYEGLKPDQLPLLLAEDSTSACAFIIDYVALTQLKNPILVVDLQNEPGRTFRVIAPALWEVENNLSTANMGFDEFADAVDEDGIYHGMSE